MNLHHTLTLLLLGTTACIAGCSQGTTPPPDATAAATAAPTVADDAQAAASAPDTAATLTAYEWRLASATDAAGQQIAAFFPTPEQAFGLHFESGRVGVTGSCNRLSAAYELTGTQALQVGPAMSTMMACPPPLAAADAAFGKFLQGSLQVALEGEMPASPNLRLTATDGTVLTFAGAPTPETRFGGPGTRAFLEVSTEPCPAPDSASGRCLTVREIQFDEQGLKTGEPGAWRSLPDGIEGYVPVAGEQHIVRVKRFEQAAAAGGAPVAHFVLDMIVQTRTVP